MQIDFISVNSYVLGNYVPQSPGPLELMTAGNFLVGADPMVNIVEIRTGTSGEQAGIAYVYEEFDGKWISTGALLGSDTAQVNFLLFVTINFALSCIVV